MNLHESLLLPENMLWAWRKIKRAYRSADCLFDQAELAQFELCLDAELDKIRRDFDAGIWKPAPLKLVPQPKKPGKDGAPRLRQYFQIAVRDQVAWAALANVLGPELDQQMPAWSYGNRLYRAAWYEEDIGEKRHSKLNIGPYRHSSGYLYRHFKHSWPLFRRHVSLAARKMVTDHIDENELDHGEALALNQTGGLLYLDANYWRRPQAGGDTLYAASLDLKKFYPSIRVEAIIRGFEEFVESYSQDHKLAALVKSMLHFQVDSSGLSEEMKTVVDPQHAGKVFEGIPTGLFVGGFLANVAMLPLDREVARIITDRRNIAHFRFVDDHEILAYDFETLCLWVAEYDALLQKFAIGSEIERDKYTPPELKWIIHSDNEDVSSLSEDELVKEASRSAEINGKKPTQLMTRTLAQVSVLAATDFDLLTDAGRSQRLEQLEWLLLANIPDHEIRGDTRAAFAASRIASLTPSLFRQNDDLLAANRRIQALIAKKSPDETAVAEIVALKELIPILETKEKSEWAALLKRHFGLLFEAFVAHPDKTRLFIRLIDYCRSTGHNGFPRITEWMHRHEEGPLKFLRSYLGAMAIHTLSRHILTASVSVKRADLLHRERSSTYAFLENISRVRIADLIPLAGESRELHAFQSDALKAFVAALLLGAWEIGEADSGLSAKLTSLARSIPIGATHTALDTLSTATRVPIGVWYHWFIATTKAHRYSAPAAWASLAALHDVSDERDWNNLRRYPASLPAAAWAKLTDAPRVLRPDDAGWLFDAARANRTAFSGLAGKERAQKQTSLALAEDKKRISLIDWVEATKLMSRSDPRRSEWTALEIIRQIIRPLFEIEGRDPDYLDRLHPANVMLPLSWRDLSENIRVDGKITWEGWRSVVTERPLSIKRGGLDDYRYSEIVKDDDRSWSRRMRSIGQLLWGILRQNFVLPSAWNIRGQERSFMELIGWDLERLPISSSTLSVLQSCLLPRNRETALMLLYPSLFGIENVEAASDTEFDLPIATPQFLDALLGQSQAVLRSSQMTILEHEPRQLIPVRLRQIGSLAEAEAVAQEIDE
ncbi:RNA-directed DNA polymerase [Bosea psychrotolerans]|uniref:Reverse transcriptase domain-containing protein n=1 Tax=Bosea psychrotolerans TaxID=1871628 RepID=A0A2S4MHJ6_9HYPH|nr:RNA-directed DNA polymerase [Bosea psychrotolerans]POR54089.1 hypothetical protein CYD53_103187 [Bosea psychrotolerans]